MQTAKTNSPTKLQPPGAGLPWLELMIARYVVFPRACRRLDWISASRKFQDEGARILDIWDTLTAEQLSERVLIRRFAGIEDSSRNWSVAMTVDHLNIVGYRMSDCISSLREGVMPEDEARIEDVKPPEDLSTVEVRARFEQLLTKASSTEAITPIPRGQGPQFSHPWFGSLDAHQWNCLLGLHQGIHRKQIEMIVAAMSQA